MRLDRGMLDSPSLGLTVSGEFGVGDGRLDLQALVAPLDGVHRVMRQVPVLGRVLRTPLVVVPVSITGRVSRSPSEGASRRRGRHDADQPDVHHASGARPPDRPGSREKPQMKRAIIVLFSVPILLVTAWWTLALVFAGPSPAWLGIALASIYALGTLAILLWLRPFIWALAACGLAFVALLIWWSTIRPSNEGDWQADVARLAQVEVRGEQLIVHNVRNFDWRTESDFTPRYVDRTYDLSALRGVDVFMSYWGSPAIAHTIMSWQFDNAPPLAISIETRKRKGQEYSAVKGFFKQYEIIYVVADERDVVGLRTNHRGEQVYLYRLKSTPALARSLLLDYVDSINGLVRRPQFYNALADNCTTSIRRHREHVDPDAPPLDWRLFANGYLDQRLYDRSIVDTSLPFEELRSLSRIDDKAKAADRDPAFSQRIREGLPGPRPLTELHEAQHEPSLF